MNPRHSVLETDVLPLNYWPLVSRIDRSRANSANADQCHVSHDTGPGRLNLLACINKNPSFDCAEGAPGNPRTLPHDALIVLFWSIRLPVIAFYYRSKTAFCIAATWFLATLGELKKETKLDSSTAPEDEELEPENSTLFRSAASGGAAKFTFYQTEMRRKSVILRLYDGASCRYRSPSDRLPRIFR